MLTVLWGYFQFGGCHELCVCSYCVLSSLPVKCLRILFPREHLAVAFEKTEAAMVSGSPPSALTFCLPPHLYPVSLLWLMRRAAANCESVVLIGEGTLIKRWSMAGLAGGLYSLFLPSLLDLNFCDSELFNIHALSLS